MGVIDCELPINAAFCDVRCQRPSGRLLLHCFNRLKATITNTFANVRAATIGRKYRGHPL